MNYVDPNGHNPENNFNWGLFGAIVGTVAFIGATIATYGAAALVTSASLAATLTVAGVTGIVSAVAGATYGGITSVMNGTDILLVHLMELGVMALWGGELL